MKSYLFIASSLVIAASALVACSSSTTDPAPTAPAGAPTVKITAPTAGATVALKATETDLPITFTTSLTLMAPGKCAGAANCGHMHLVVDGTSCNAVGFPYNEAVVASGPTAAGLDYCKTGIPGAHTITLELHNDDHSPIKDSTGATISDTVKVTVTGGAAADAGGTGDAATDGG